MANTENGAIPDIGENTKEVAQSFIETIGVDPCLLAIVTVILIALRMLSNNNKHQQKMEEIRMKQFKELKGGNGGN